MKVLATGAGTHAMFEPDHLNVWGLGMSGMHPYLPVDQDDADYENIYTRAFQGSTFRPFTLSRGYLRHVMREAKAMLPSDNRRVLVKSVYSILNTEWLCKRFRPRVVVLLRNPYSVAHSIHRKWPDANLKLLIDQPKLMADYLGSYREIIERAQSPYGVLAARIGAYYKIVLQMAARNPDWLVVKHEDLCRDPMQGYRQLFSSLDLVWTRDTDEALRLSNRPKQDDAVSHVQRVASEEPDKWRSLLSQSQIDEIREAYTAFSTGVYEDLA